MFFHLDIFKTLKYSSGFEDDKSCCYTAVDFTEAVCEVTNTSKWELEVHFNPSSQLIIKIFELK